MASTSKGITVYGRLSFDDLFQPTASTKDGPLKYRCNILLDPNTAEGRKDIKRIELLIKEAELDKFKKSPMTYKSDDRKCFLDGDTMTYKEGKNIGEVYTGYEGMWVLKATNDKRPSVVDQDRTPLTEDSGRPYAGCYCFFHVHFFAVNGQDKGGPGIFCSIDAVQYAKKGEAFGAATVDPDDVFEDISNDDKFASDDDDGTGSDDEEEVDPLS